MIYTILVLAILAPLLSFSQEDDKRTTRKVRVGAERQPNPFEAYLGRPIGYDTDGFGLYSTDRIEMLVRAAADKAKSECNGRGGNDTTPSTPVLGALTTPTTIDPKLCEPHNDKVKQLMRKISSRDQVKNAAIFAEVGAIASVAGAMGCDLANISNMILDY